MFTPHTVLPRVNRRAPYGDVAPYGRVLLFDSATAAETHSVSISWMTGCVYATLKHDLTQATACRCFCFGWIIRDVGRSEVSSVDAFVKQVYVCKWAQVFLISEVIFKQEYACAVSALLFNCA